MLKLKTVTIRNFRSYGDYDTTLRLDNLGPVLITGEIDDPTKRNGAGKSTLVDAIIWCLFGKLPSKDRPADHVINWETKQNCSVTLETDEGYTIQRTRNLDGHNDLLIKGNGVDITDSTNDKAQQHLKRLFGLDFDIFMNSTFFAQFNKAFLELSDVKRKQSLERILGLSKFAHYVDVATEKIKAIELEQAKSKLELEQRERDVFKITQTIENTHQLSDEFETKRQEDKDKLQEELDHVNERYQKQIDELLSKIQAAKVELAKVVTYDVAKLKTEWSSYNRILEAIKQTEDTLENIRTAIVEVEKNIAVLSSRGTNSTHKQSLDEAQKRLLNSKVRDQIDVAALKRSWDEFSRDHRILEGRIESKKAAINEKKTLKKRLETELENWEQKIETTCPTCKQVIPKAHAESAIKPLLEEIRLIIEQIETETNALKPLEEALVDHTPPTITMNEATLLNEQRQSELELQESMKREKEKYERLISQENDAEQARTKELNGEKEKLKQLETWKSTWVDKQQKFKEKAVAPIATLEEAAAKKKEYDSTVREIEAYESSIKQTEQAREQRKEDIRDAIKDTLEKPNPYSKIIEDQNKELTESKKKKETSQAKVAKFDTLLEHLTYIKQSYSDRRKIKAYLLQRLIPYFNERIRYYLKSFGCGFDLEFNAFLQSKTGKWPYELWSGGERRRIDLAIMFAQHDLHISIYEQQCNILVFDEVDSRLDADGVRAFVELLYKEFVDQTDKTKPNSILVISHKDEMRDAFPAKIMVRKENGFSRIEEIRG